MEPIGIPQQENAVDSEMNSLETASHENNFITNSPSTNLGHDNYRKYSNTNAEKLGFMSSGFTSSGNFVTPRASLLTSKLAKAKSKMDQDSGIDSGSSSFPYPDPKSFKSTPRPMFNNNEGSNNNNNSMSQSYEKERSFFTYNAPSVVSSSYSSAPISMGQSSNGFIPVQHPHSIATTHPIQMPQVQHQREELEMPKNLNFARPSTATTNITMETAVPEEIALPQVAQPSTVPLQAPEPFNAAAEIYNPNVYTETTNGVSVDSCGVEHLNIVQYPTEELLLMLSSLLRKIIETNDSLHPNHYNNASQLHESNKFTANVLAFHGKNVPAIPIYNYFLRILKYCPMTNEVFLSLLVYFDRIAKRANVETGKESGTGSSSQLFVIDSYNIHRLIIAGVTVSSKFFSDVFYKNGRYARVGGLPLDELNHIELQFILLTDFKLLIQPDELQRYADLLLKFWRRETAKAKEI